MPKRHLEELIYFAFCYEFSLRFPKLTDRLLRFEHGGYVIGNAEKNARKRSLLKPGIPDYGLFYAVEPRQMLWIEFKVKGNKLTAKQEGMRNILTEWGSKHVTCYSAEEGINEVIKYLKGETNEKTLY